MLAPEFPTVKQQLLGRYVNFTRKLFSSISPEVRIVASMVARCARANTGKNLMNIERETGMDPMLVQPAQVTEAVQRSLVPPTEGWRWQYLGKLLPARRQMEEKCENVDEITLLIDSLCSS